MIGLYFLLQPIRSLVKLLSVCLPRYHREIYVAPGVTYGCIRCPYGTYKSGLGTHVPCTQCPTGTTTVRFTATSVSDCGKPVEVILKLQLQSHRSSVGMESTFLAPHFEQQAPTMPDLRYLHRRKQLGYQVGSQGQQRSDFETQRRHHQKSKTGVSVDPQKGLRSMSYNFKAYKQILGQGDVFTCVYVDRGGFTAGTTGNMTGGLHLLGSASRRICIWVGVCIQGVCIQGDCIWNICIQCGSAAEGVCIREELKAVKLYNFYYIQGLEAIKVYHMLVSKDT